MLTFDGEPRMMTRREILTLERIAPGYVVVTLDRTGRTTALIGEVLTFDRESGFGFALSQRTGMIYRFEIVGKPRRDYYQRVKYVAARDQNDMAGLLAFDGEEHTGYVSSKLPSATPERPDQRRARVEAEAAGLDPAYIDTFDDWRDRVTR